VPGPTGVREPKSIAVNHALGIGALAIGEGDGLASIYLCN
jgi:hypothetical protein